MPDYNLGRAHGTVKIDYDGSGTKAAKRDIHDVGDEAQTTGRKVDDATKESGKAYRRLDDDVRRTKTTPDIDQNAWSELLHNLRAIQTNTAKSSNLLNTFDGRVKLMTAGIALAVPHVAGLGVALASLTGLAGVAAGALAGLGAVGGTVVTGISGVGDAFKAAAAQSKAAGSSAGASAKAQRSAMRAIEDAKRSLADAEKNLEQVQVDAARAVVQALRQVVSAQRDLQNAQRDAVRAQQQLNAARQQAVRDLEDMQFALTGGSLDERQAILDVKKAQEELNKTLADPTHNADNVEQATINLEKQKLALEEAQKANQRLAVDSQAATAAGVDGSSQVVSAQDSVRSAMQSVADAQQSLADAQQNVKDVQVNSAQQIADATQGIVDAQRSLADAYANAADAGSAAGAKLNDALANLSPNARSFVKEVLGMKDAWQEVKNSVQDKLFAGLAAEVKPLASIWFPLLKEGMGQVATGLNGIIKETVAYLKTTEAQQNVANIFKNTGLALGNMKGILRDLLAAFLDIASVGSDFLPDMATGAANAAKSFRDFVHEAKESGRLKEWMQGAMDTAGKLWELIKNISSIIGSLFKGIDQEGGGALNTLTALTGQIAKFLKSAEGQDALSALGKILKSIGTAYGKVFLSFLDAAAQILVALQPFITAFADAVGTYLAGAIQIALPILKGLADIIGALGPSLGPVVAGVYAANKAIDAAKIAWKGLNVVMNQNPFLIIAVVIIALVVLIVQNWDTISAYLSGIWNDITTQATAIWTGIRDFFVGIWNDITTQFNAAITGIRDFFVGIARDISSQWNAFWRGLGDFFSGIGTDIKNQIGRFVDSIVGFFRELPGKVWNFVKSLPEKFLNLGKDIVSGILRGLGNLASALWNKLKDAVSAAWDSVLDFFGINSPSKLAADAGENIVAGLVRGIDRSTSSAVAAATAMAQAVGTELTGATGSLATTLSVGADTSGVPTSLPMTAAMAANLATAPVRGGDGAAAGGRTVVVDNVNVYVQGNLDPTNPVAFRQTMVRLKTELRSLDKEYK